jgi:nucleotide-binding universal stress UspA family protein
MAVRAKRIVVGFDGSPGAHRALDTATQLLGYGSTLTVVHVLDSHGNSRDALSEAREVLLSRLVTAEYLERRGDPGAELVAVASELGADVIVVGRRDLVEEAGAEPGSVSSDVVRCARCDVLVVG